MKCTWDTISAFIYRLLIMVLLSITIHLELQILDFQNQEFVGSATTHFPGMVLPLTTFRILD